MTDPVWWYVLAGFLFGFILSTLWEWLYFRQRRMRIENRRIAELEATVRALSVAPHSVENTTSLGLAAGYQSPLVFLEGEEKDVDTVEVIVPATPEPVKVDQSTATQPAPALQPLAETQAVTSKWSTSAHVHNGYRVVDEAPESEPGTSIAVGGETSHRSVSPAALAAAAVAAIAARANDKDQTEQAAAPDLAGAPQPETIPDTAPPVTQVSAAEPSTSAATPTDASSPAGQGGGTTPDTADAVRHPAALAAAAVAATAAIANDKDQTEQAEVADLAGAPQPETIPDTAPPVTQVSAAEPSTSAATPTDASSPAGQGGGTTPDTADAVRHPAAVAAAAVAATAAIANDKDQTEQAAAPDLAGAPQPETIPDTAPPVTQVSAAEPSTSAATPTDASSPAGQEGGTAPGGTADAVRHPADEAAEARP